MNEYGRGLRRRAARRSQEPAQRLPFHPEGVCGAPGEGGSPPSPLFPPTALSLGVGAKGGGAPQDTPSVPGLGTRTPRHESF